MYNNKQRRRRLPGAKEAPMLRDRIMERGKTCNYLILSLIFFIASCAATHQQAVQSLRDAKVCCQSMAGFQYEPLPEGKRVDFQLDASSPAFRFESGKSFFKAFSLPKKQVPYYVRIRSFGLGETIKAAHIFYPQLALLDEHYRVVAKNDPGAVFVKKAGMTETASVSWTALGIKFDDALQVDNPDARYVVVYTTDEMLEAVSPYSTVQIVPVIIPGIVTAVPIGKEAVLIPHSPHGILSIEVTDKPLPDTRKP
jgi:maltose operon protein